MLKTFSPSKILYIEHSSATVYDDSSSKLSAINQLTQGIIGAAIAVHRVLGPGLLESAYQECLCQELAFRGIPFERQVPIPLEYGGIRLEAGYRLDILVARRVVVEVKAIEAIAPIHEAQLLTYLRPAVGTLGC